MRMPYTDRSKDIYLRLSHELNRLKYVPFPGAGTAGRLLARMIPRPAPPGPCVVRTIHGFLLAIDPGADSGIERTLFDQGTYEEGTLRVMSYLLRAGGTFVDVGANIGVMTLYAASTLLGKGRVLAFEPLPGTYDILRRNLELNEFGNVEAVRMALGSTSGIVKIFDNMAANRGSSSLIAPDADAGGHETPIERLDDYLSARPETGRIACVKIDVEGWELEVLKGATETLSGAVAPSCIIECSHFHPTQGGSPRHIFDFFREVNSYRIFRLQAGKERPSKLVEVRHAQDLPEHDNLFCLTPEQLDDMPGSLFMFHSS
jgi:FkbM family methyltransferase